MLTLDYKAETLAAYRRNASGFARKFQELLDLGRREEFQQLLDLLGDRRDVLDLGCGAGEHAAYFQSRGLAVTCLDFCPEMLQICRARGLPTVEMDIEHLDLPAGSYDAAWSVTSLLHIPKEKIPGILEVLHGALRPGGIAFVCLKKGFGEEFVPDGHGGRRYFAYWQREEFARAFEPFFEELSFRETQPLHRTFLQWFLRRR